jgi:N-acetylmuramic acid 6-phosphate etherase
VAIVIEAERMSLFGPSGFHRAQLEAAEEAGAKTGLIFFGRRETTLEAMAFPKRRNPDCVTVPVPVPQMDFLLDGVTRVGVKMMLNALSTCTMVRLGRVMGNYMVWVVPSNLKLIDRATRYISKLTGLSYERANELLFDVIEYVEPRMRSDRAYPPVVALAVTRQCRSAGNEEAERVLLAELRG